MCIKTLLGAGSAVLLATTNVFAHHPGGVGNIGGAGPIVTISAATLAEGQSSIAIMFELTRIAAFSNQQLAGFAGKHIHAHSLHQIAAPSVALAYGLTNDVMISARMPYVIRSDIREGHHSHQAGIGAVNEAVERGNSSGLGDVTALAHWRVLNNRETGTQFALLGGFRAPAGSTNRTDRAGDTFETEFQPGSGSWDWMVGAAATQKSGRWSFDANVLYAFAGRGEQQTDLGNRFQYNIAASYRLLGSAPSRSTPMRLGALPEPMYHGAGRGQQPHAHIDPPAQAGPSFDLVLELNGEWHGRQVVDGVEDANSGGRVVYLSPGVRVSGDNWSTFVSAGVPVMTNIYGVQAGPDYRLVSGVAVSF